MQTHSKQPVPLVTYAALAALAITAGTLAYTLLDKRVAYYFRANPQRRKKLADAVGSLTSPEFALTTAGALLAVGAYRYCIRKDALPHLVPYVRVPASVGLAYVLKKSLKYLITRKRPLVLFVNQEFGFEWFASGEKLNQSFPSGHALSSFALAHAAARSWPALAIPLYSSTSLLILTRLAVNDHFLSDLLAGATLGIASSEVLYRTVFAHLPETSAK